MDNGRVVSFSQQAKPISSPQRLGSYGELNYVLRSGNLAPLDNSDKSAVKQEAVGGPIRRTIERHEPMLHH